MKRIALAIVGIVIVGGLLYAVITQPSTLEVDKQSATTTVYEPVVEQKIIDQAIMRVKKAQEAEMDRIEKEANQMKTQFVQNELDEIEAVVWREIAAEAEAKAVEKEKATGAY